MYQVRHRHQGESGSSWTSSIALRIAWLVPIVVFVASPLSALSNADAFLTSSSLTPAQAHRASPRVLALMKVQTELDRAADRIKALSNTPSSGYGGLVVAPSDHSLTMYWHGPIPDDVQRELGQIRGHGIRVTTHPAAFSQQALESAAMQVLREAVGDAAAPPVQAAWRITSAGPRPDGSGIDVGVAGPAGQRPALPLAVNATQISVPMNITVRQPVPHNRL